MDRHEATLLLYMVGLAVSITKSDDEEAGIFLGHVVLATIISPKVVASLMASLNAMTEEIKLR